MSEKESATSVEEAGATKGETFPAPSPRALRVMALVRWLLLAVVTALAAYVVFTFWGPSSERSSTARAIDRFYCAMHPQIRSPEPGECPICHMNLEPIPAERRADKGPATASSTSSAPRPSDVLPVTVSLENQQLAGLSTVAVESGSRGTRMRVPGLISAPETGVSEVRVRAPGFVEKVAVRQSGVKVTRGQPLAFVYSPEIYRAEEEFIAATRWDEGASSALGSKQPADALKTAGRRALELLGMNAHDIDEIARTGQPMRALAVRATASGVVTRFNAVLGSRADPEMVLYEIADLSTVWVVASVSESDLSFLREGTDVAFSLPGRAADPLTGKVQLIEPSLDEATRTARVRIVVPNADGALRPGQFGEVEFELPEREGLFVPRDSVIRTGAHDYVYVAVAADRFEPRSVVIGASSGGFFQLVSGVAAGERVVARGSFVLDSESRLAASLEVLPTAGVTPTTATKPVPEVAK